MIGRGDKGMTSPSQHLDKDRCCPCGGLAINYRRPPQVERVCDKCYRAYDASGQQIPNWAWRRGGDGFESFRAERAEA